MRYQDLRSKIPQRFSDQISGWRFDVQKAYPRSMSELLEALRERARSRNARIVLAEGEDPRVLAAAAEALKTGLCEPYLVGDRDQLRRAARDAGVELGEVPILDPATDPELEGLAQGFADQVRERRLKIDDPHALARDPLHYAGLLVFNERAHGAVMGAVATTADTLRARPAHGRRRSALRGRHPRAS